MRLGCPYCHNDMLQQGDESLLCIRCDSVIPTNELVDIEVATEQAWTGYDLDKTIAVHGTWYGPYHIGAPILPMIARIKAQLAAGERVKIVTARVSEPRMRVRMKIIEAIQAWCVEHIGQALEVTDRKDYKMLLLYDDRARQVIANEGIVVGDGAA